MKKTMLLTLSAGLFSLLVGCGSKIEGTYVWTDPKVEGKVHIILESSGKGSTNMGGFEHGLQYEVNGDKITMRFQGGDQGSGNIWTIKDGSITSPFFGTWTKK